MPFAGGVHLGPAENHVVQEVDAEAPRSFPELVVTAGSTEEGDGALSLSQDAVRQRGHKSGTNPTTTTSAVWSIRPPS
jgi:hypothetical protein